MGNRMVQSSSESAWSDGLSGVESEEREVGEEIGIARVRVFEESNEGKVASIELREEGALLSNVERSGQSSDGCGSEHQIEKRQNKGVGTEDEHCGRKLGQQDETCLTEEQQIMVAEFRKLRSAAKVSKSLGLPRDRVRLGLKRIREKLGLTDLSELWDKKYGDPNEVMDDPIVDDDRVTAKKLLVVLEQQGYRCALTGRELTPGNSSLDHKVAISDGGLHVMENVWFLHNEVNRAKGAMTAKAFIAMCHEVVDHNPVQRI